MRGRVIVIGASADGIEAISHVLRGLPAGFAAPVFVVQHIGRASTGYLPTILGRAGPLPAVHPHEREAIRPGIVYVAPPNLHMIVGPGPATVDDGTAGLAAIKQRGGVTIVQDPDEAAAPSMPRSALAKVPIDHVLRIDQIAPTLIELVAAGLTGYSRSGEAARA